MGTKIKKKINKKKSYERYEIRPEMKILRVTRIPEEERGKVAKSLFKKIAENFPNLRKNLDL